MPASSGGDDTAGTDALHELLSWGELGQPSAPVGGNAGASGPSRARDAVGDDGDIAAPVAEADTHHEIGPETSYDAQGRGDPGFAAAGTGWLDHRPNPYVQEGYGPVGYGQTSWPPQGYVQPQWPSQGTYQARPKVPKRPPRSTPGWFGVALVAAIIGAVVGGGVVALFTSRSPQTIVKEYFPSKGQKVQVGDVQSILASVLPAVVSIDTSSFRGVGAVGSYVQGAGTGMIIKSSGVILTNNHVIEGAQTVTVTLYGQVKQFPAKIIGTDAEKDIALVQVEGAGNSLPTVSSGTPTRPSKVTACWRSAMRSRFATSRERVADRQHAVTLLAASEFPKLTVGNELLPSTCTRAMSFSASVRMILAGNCLTCPYRVTVTVCAPSMTWLLVRMTPLDLMFIPSRALHI